MILTKKPRVFWYAGQYWVHVEHRNGIYQERWYTHASAMNCALAIARTSRCVRPEEVNGGSWKAY